MKGLEFDPVAGRLTIVNGTRTVATSDGTLVNLLPTEHDFGDTVMVFPDVPKSWWYHWQWQSASNAFGVTSANSAATYNTAIPTEQSSKTTLLAAPPGADIFVGLVKLQRTVAPTSTWWSHSIDVMPCVNNQWMLWDGSALVEQAEGMSRAIHVYIDGSANLVIERQYSSSDVINNDNWGYFGDAGPTSSGSRSGHEETFGTKGFPIRLNHTSGPDTDSKSVAALLNYQTCRQGGSNQASVTDTTNYSSTYVVSVKGFFGRRS